MDAGARYTIVYIANTRGRKFWDLNKLMESAINFGFTSQKIHKRLSIFNKRFKRKTECKHHSMPAFEKVEVKRHAF
jgi:hypothetical protein